MSSETHVVSTAASPYADLKSVPLDSVRWTQGFWAERYAQTCEVTIRRLWELLADPNAGHVLENFRVAAGLEQGEYAGTNWQDEWLYKWLEAASCIWRVTGDAWLEERIDNAIELIGKAQEPDGYVATQITVPKKERFQEPREHEVYNMGHLTTAAVIHSRMAGKDSLLSIAISVGDFLCQTLGVTVEPCFAHNPSAIMGLVELYRATGERKYLECAKLIVDQRGCKPKPGTMWERKGGICGSDQIQDRVPLRREQEVVGHNVFFTYLFAGATDVYLETGDETLIETLRRLWEDLTSRKMNINTGISPMGFGLSPRGDPLCEAVGAPYFLPNASAYNETCGQIGNFMWNYRLLCCEGDAAYADLMELSIYNGILGGIGLDGASWFYRNPLRRYDTAHNPSGHNDLAERIQPGLRQICCPSNLVRTMAELQSYFYSTSDHTVWVHHYGGSELALDQPQVGRVRLEQETDYPWNGKVLLTVLEAPSDRLTIKLRIPVWAEGATIKLNGMPAEAKPGTYASLEAVWSAGDVIELDLPMPPRLMQAHPRVEQLRNQAAVMRGPILYCLESADLPEGLDLSNVYVPSDIELEPVPLPELPFGIQALQGEALHCPEAPWDGDLYRALSPRGLEPIPVRLAPYFAWANRGPAAMSVWLPVILRA